MERIRGRGWWRGSEEIEGIQGSLGEEGGGKRRVKWRRWEE